MSLQYRVIGWNRQKRIYDSVLVSSLLLYLLLFVGLGAWVHPFATIETLLIRGLGTVSLLLLHVILSIGPLCRLDRRFLPLLYNRRHLGVTMFLLALGHGVFALIQFHGLGDVNPLASLLLSNRHYDSLAQFPFQQLGFLALLILFLMAATSHDFWLHNLTPRVWKCLHMGVYAAYGLLIAHVTLGALQSETSQLLVAPLLVGMVVVLGLHLLAAYREHSVDKLNCPAGMDGFVEVCSVDSIPNNRARVISLGGERVAVFRYDGKVSALSNVCAHQNGPLGEGKIIDGCVTCPWHGYQYLPDSGTSPPPFHEKVATFRVKVINGTAFVHAHACELGTALEPALVKEREPQNEDEFYVGYEPKAPGRLARSTKRVVAGLIALAAVVPLLLVFGQSRFLPSSFEYQQYRNFEGVIEESPAPSLLVKRPGATDLLPAFSRYVLAAPGKHGVSSQMRGRQGTRVQLQGSLIYREGLTMIEVVPGTMHPLSLPAQSSKDLAIPGNIDLGSHTLTGEIVDSKCYFGVMNPGNGKVHRDCAVRCISGGLPPAFLVRSEDGKAIVLLLQGSDGRQINQEVLDHVAEPLQIRGQAIRSGDTLILRAEPSTFQAVAAPKD